jgi:hypothetical protein
MQEDRKNAATRQGPPLTSPASYALHRILRILYLSRAPLPLCFLLSSVTRPGVRSSVWQCCR